MASKCHVAITVLVDSWSEKALSGRKDGNAELESSSCMLLLAGSGLGACGLPRGYARPQGSHCHQHLWAPC